jgi:cellulose synthase operon protein C
MFNIFRHGLALLFLVSVGQGCAGKQATVTKLVNGKLIETRSVSPRAYEHATRAMVYEEEERYEEAVAEYTAAIEYDQESPELYARLAEAYIELDNAPKAQAAIDRSAALAPTVDGAVAAAHLALHRGDAKGAAAALERALPLLNFSEDAEDAERVYLERADAQLMALLPHDAMATLETLLSSLPSSQMGLYRQASISWALGELAAARRYLERLIEIEPDHLEARLLLARLQTVQKNADHARTSYVEALSRSEDDLSVAAMYATFLEQQGLHEEAAALADQMQTNEMDASTLSLRMELERAAGRLARAIEIADAVLATLPGPEMAGRILMAKGAVLEASHRPDEAARVFEAIAQDSPSFAEGCLRAAALHRDLGQIKEAQALLTTLSTDALEETMQAEVLVARSLVAGSSGKLEEARQLLQTADPALAGTNRIALARAVLEDKYGDWKQALALSEAVFAKNLGSAEALNFWAFVAAEKKHMLPTALARAEAALAFDPGSPAIMDTLGWIHMQMDKPLLAQPFLEGAALIEPDDPEILGHVASLYLRLGKRELALGSATHALELSRDPSVRAKLEALIKTAKKEPLQ